VNGAITYDESQFAYTMNEDLGINEKQFYEYRDVWLMGIEQLYFPRQLWL
jgi:hypothetical protein